MKSIAFYSFGSLQSSLLSDSFGCHRQTLLQKDKIFQNYVTDYVPSSYDPTEQELQVLSFYHYKVVKIVSKNRPQSQILVQVDKWFNRDNKCGTERLGNNLWFSFSNICGSKIENVCVIWEFRYLIDLWQGSIGPN